MTVELKDTSALLLFMPLFIASYCVDEEKNVAFTSSYENHCCVKSG